MNHQYIIKKMVNGGSIDEEIKLITCDINQNIPDDGGTLPHVAVSFSAIDAVLILLRNGADLNLADKEGAQAINCANYCEKSEVGDFIWDCMKKRRSGVEKSM